jgi:hypothetical protein
MLDSPVITHLRTRKLDWRISWYWPAACPVVLDQAVSVVLNDVDILTIMVSSEPCCCCGSQLYLTVLFTCSPESAGRSPKGMHTALRPPQSRQWCSVPRRARTVKVSQYMRSTTSAIPQREMTPCGAGSDLSMQYGADVAAPR